MRHSTYWKFYWDKSTPVDGAKGIVMASREKKKKGSLWHYATISSKNKPYKKQI